MYSGFECYVVKTDPEVSEEHEASIFRTNNKLSKKSASPGWCLLILI
jgi:hypothetical protein